MGRELDDAAAIDDHVRPLLLIAEDDSSVRNLLSTIVEDAGFRSVAVETGLDALRLARELDVAVVLLDIGLPDMSGLEVLSALRNDARTLTLPVIIVSGSNTEEHLVEGLDLGASDYVTKPFAPRELVARIEAQLRMREAWVAATQPDWQLREVVARGIIGLTHGSAGIWMCDAVSRELRRLPEVIAAAVVRFHGDLVTIDGCDVPTSLPPSLPVALDGSVGVHLAKRAMQGPWLLTDDDPDLLTPLGVADELAVACAPLEPVPGAIQGVLIVATDPGGPGGRSAARMRALAVAVDFSPIVAAVLAAEPGPEAVASRTWLIDVIQNRRLRSVFQPVIDLRTGSTAGFEALTRFEDGASPELAFDLARHLDLAGKLEILAAETALREAGGLPDRTYLSLNVSPSVLTHDGQVGELVRGSEHPVVVEITERAPVEDYGLLREALGRLGPDVRVAVDDAGSGYASLSHVLALRPQIIKLDRVLIDGLDRDRRRQSLLASMTSFARETGAVLIAEGVETPSQLAAVRRCGVDFAQGFLLGAPAPVGATR